MADDLRRALTNLLRKAEMTGDVRQRGLRDAREVPSVSEGRIRAPRDRNAESTTPTGLEEFARSVFAPAYRAMA